MRSDDPFGTRDKIKFDGKEVIIYRLERLEDQGLGNISQLPNSIKILLENITRHVDGRLVTEQDVENLAKWRPNNGQKREIPFNPARVILQDLTGVPSVVDLAALRSALKRYGGNPAEINPLIPVDLVIDHSIQVDDFGNPNALSFNEAKEFERNKERYTFLRWAQNAFKNFRIIPPGGGIVHQVNLEYLSSVVQMKKIGTELIVFPDTLIGTDSHTTMINGIGVLGWGVGGIEAEAVMLGQPYYMPIPEVVGFKLYGELNDGITATDLVLTVTQILRRHGVVGKFVEFYGPGLKNLSLQDRATISNMSPEYGATMGYFPIDEETLNYLIATGRGKLVKLVKVYTQNQGLFLEDPSKTPLFSETLELDLSSIEPSLAGPKRPQDRIPLKSMRTQFRKDLVDVFGKKCEKVGLETKALTDGSVVIAAITSCTNTSNPSVLIGAGLLAKKAVERGLKVRSHVKTSLAPGSRVVIKYLQETGLLHYLEALGFYLVGYGCTTCIGNSGPLPKAITDEIQHNNLVVAAVLSGNRNFEGRVSPFTKINYLASPPLVVAFAIAGKIDVDLTTEPLGIDSHGSPVYLKDIWPKREEIADKMRVLTPKMFKDQYSDIFEGIPHWKNLDIPRGELYKWNPDSTYIREPPFFIKFPLDLPRVKDIKGARVIALLGGTVTTDHISPAGAIPLNSPAGKYLISRGIKPVNFNSFGSRRGNHEVMMRGTFGNIRLKNKLTPGKEGNWTRYFPSNEELSIYDAAIRYAAKNIPLIVLAGKEYGTGSSRDWAAKGTYLLGIKAVIAESFERIHRSNLVGMGVLPLQFPEGESCETLGLQGHEIFDLIGLESLKLGSHIRVIARDGNDAKKEFSAKLRLDTPIELEYYRNGGILHTVLRNMIKKSD
ncbi:MAG: aconitate hydratase AcnA [Candidatus Helarchaeota archaeon]